MDDYTAARTIALALISNKLDTLTVEQIGRCVDEACGHFPDLSKEHRDKLVRELETNFQTVIGEERELVGKDEGWEYWLPERRGQLDWEYWQRYKELLKQGPMNEDVRRRLEESTDRVLGLLGDPLKGGSWDRRGLVVGLVQSGKTSHYVGLINKAVDAGYKVVVILTGFTESLRVQTQIRLEEGFLGYYLEPGARNGDLKSITVGVGLISPGRKPDSVTTRSNDFKKAIADNFGIQVGGKEILFVIKKNVSVLKNLLNWIENLGNATDANGRKFVKGVPLLVIDDESDVGSIDTKKGNIVDDDPDPDHEPSRINEQIRKLLSLFDQSSYVGYTATPFANVLIHDSGRTDELGEDLFPRSFIISLPTPSDHIGPGMVFGGNSEDGARDGLPVIRHVPDSESQVEDAWIPPVHRKWHQPLHESRDEVPPSLRKAILSFILVCSARRVRRISTKHNSMLVHVTRFNDVQDKVHDQIDKELNGIVDRLRTGAASTSLLEELEQLWVDDFRKTTRIIAAREGSIFHNPEHEWEQIKGEVLAAASAIQVRTINGLAGEVLDYEKHRESGLQVIAIGGDKLSRGLTLEGLSVSYFLRCSRMYDTLMQMGRWFGYRPGYLDLCRLYTTDELCGWFGHIANATEELRTEFDLMANSSGTPKDFGLRVRSHPELMVTSQVKMRHGQKIQVTFQGDIVETINFHRRAEVVDRNWKALKNLIGKLDMGAGRNAEPPRANSAMWDEVDAENVIAFLDQYREHESAKKVRTRLLIQFIEQELKQSRLTSWTVLISGGSKAGGTIENIGLPLVVRDWHLTGSTDPDKAVEKEKLIQKGQYRIKRLVNPPDEKVDLDKKAKGVALRETMADWKMDPRGKKEPTEPGGRFLRRQRDPSEGLLILYPLDPGDSKAENADTPIVGFAISFPVVSEISASKVTYTVNNVYQQQELTYS